MERHRKRVESHQLNIDEYYSRIPKISGQRYGLRVSPLFPRQVRAFTAILIIEDADQTWRSNFPLKRLGWQRLSRRIDPASRIFDTPQYFVMDIQYLRWWTNELIDWQQKKKIANEIASVWSSANILRVKGRRKTLGRCLEIARFRDR